MRRTLPRAAALVLAVAVVAFVVYASSVGARAPVAAASAEPPAAGPPPSAAALPAATAERNGNRYGVIGPSTKADPHAVRRAVESLAPSSAPAAR